jgi:hypothetical protein
MKDLIADWKRWTRAEQVAALIAVVTAVATMASAPFLIL